MADVFTHFNYLHAIPEIGMKEFKTSAYGDQYFQCIHWYVYHETAYAVL